MKNLILILLLSTMAFGQSSMLLLMSDEGLPQPSETLNNMLIAHWKLDETTGSRVDSYGDNDLSVSTGTVNYADGKVGNSASFDSTNYLYVNDNAGLSAGNSNWTISAWVKIDNLIGGESKAFLSKGYNSATAPSGAEYALYWSTANRWNLLVTGNDSVKILTANTFGAVTADTWYHILAWRDSSRNTLHIRVNDSSEDSLVTGQYKDGPISFYLGQFGAAGNIRKFKGEVDEVSFWKRLLTDEEKTFLYNGGKGATYTNGKFIQSTESEASLDKGTFLFDMALAGDIQVEAQSEFSGVRTTIDSINAYSPDFVLLAGDLGWIRKTSTAPSGGAYYDTLYNYLAMLNSPFFFTTGNHDNDITLEGDSNFVAFNHLLGLTDALVDSGGYLNMDTIDAYYEYTRTDN